MELITEYPLWFSVFCLIAGVLYAGILYFKNAKQLEVSASTLKLLFLLRFLTVSFLSFLLLAPLIKTIQREVEKPLVIFAHDNSASIVLTKDSTFVKGDFQKNYQELISEVATKFEVKSLSYADKVSDKINFDYSGKQTDLSQLFKEIQNRYEGRNLGAVVVSGDGIINKGTPPEYSSGFLKCPLYAIALGDTSVKKDLFIQTINHNRIAYLGNDFPVEILVSAKQANGEKIMVSIFQGPQKLYSQNITISGNNSVYTFKTLLKSQKSGLQRYTVFISKIEGETSYRNNTADFYIDVLDNRDKILIVANSPHPDIAAIRQAIETNDNYELKVMLGELPVIEKINEYSLIIFHQLPSISNNIRNLVEEVNKRNIPMLFVIGNQTAITTLNTLNTGIKITTTKNISNEAEPTLSKDFSLFSLSDNARGIIEKLPPLTCPFGNYQMSNAAYTFLNQRISSLETNYPLFAFNQLQENKIGMICGEGIWKWRLFNYQTNKNHDAFNEIILKTIQYLSVKSDKSLFRVNSKNRFNENEPIVIDAELYNESYELINEPEVSINIINNDNKKYPFTFSKTNTTYRLNAGQLPIGEYRYEASAKSNGKLLTDKGFFTITELKVEEMNITANHSLLNRLVSKHNGKLFYPNQLNELKKLLTDENNDIKSISYSQKKFSELIHFKWIFFLLLTLLSMEWFIRKRNGGY